MKKTFRFIGMVLVAMLISIGFSACGGDDENDESSSTSKWLIGTWYWYYVDKNGETELAHIITLKKDGTGTWEYKDDREGRIDNITYVYNEEKHSIRFVEYRETYTFTERKGAYLYFEDSEDLWVKQDPSEKLLNSNESFNSDSENSI